MRLVSATDLAVAIAVKAETLRYVERASRLGGTYVALEDDHGVIAVHNSNVDACARV